MFRIQKIESLFFLAIKYKIVVMFIPYIFSYGICDLIWEMHICSSHI